MTAPFNPHAARSRWFTAPPADETPREAALRRDLLGAVEWAEGLVQVGWLLPETADWGSTALHLHPKVFPDTWANRDKHKAECQPVYVVREAR